MPRRERQVLLQDLRQRKVIFGPNLPPRYAPAEPIPPRQPGSRLSPGPIPRPGPKTAQAVRLPQRPDPLPQRLALEHAILGQEQLRPVPHLLPGLCRPGRPDTRQARQRGLEGVEGALALTVARQTVGAQVGGLEGAHFCPFRLGAAGLGFRGLVVVVEEGAWELG